MVEARGLKRGVWVGEENPLMKPDMGTWEAGQAGQAGQVMMMYANEANRGS